MIGTSIRVAAVVVTYNRKELLLECIEHLCAQTVSPLIDIIIVDNASTDGTEEALREYIDRRTLLYVNTGENLGGAGGFNRAMREAAEKNYDFVWVMDDDCMPTPNALEELLVYADVLGTDFGWLSSKVLWKDGSICTMNVQRQDLTKNITDFTDELIPADLASFVSLFVPTSVIQAYGLPIADFFLWTDDWEFTRRISRELPCYVVTSSVVVHKSAQNLGANVVSESGERLDRFKRLYRNDVVLYRGEGARGFFYEAARISGHTARVLTKSKDHRVQRLASVWGGTIDGLKFHPDIEYPRLLPRCEAKNKDVRVLEILGEPISYGGEESYVVRTISNMDRTGLVIDVATPYYCDNNLYKEEVVSWGGTVYELGVSFNPGHSRSNLTWPIRDFFLNHIYDIVHVHSGSTTAMAIIASEAKRSGARVVVHAHIGGESSNIKHLIAKSISAIIAKENMDCYCACSMLAAEHMFSKRNAAHCTILPNGVDLQRFAFNPTIRAFVRQELGFKDDCIVLGNVGRLSLQKNQIVLIQALKYLRDEKINACALLVGEGELREGLEKAAVELGVSEHIVFTGAVDTVEDYYQAMDVFVFPSLYEGLGIVAVEAQASGLPTVLSPSVPHEVALTDEVYFARNAYDSKSWANLLRAVWESNGNRAALSCDRGRLSEYSVHSTAKCLRNVYDSLLVTSSW